MELLVNLNKKRIEQMQRILQEKFLPTELMIEDESDEHIGHSGARNGAGHFNLKIKSDAFKNKSLIQRHQMIYQALATMMEKDIHALSIKADT